MEPEGAAVREGFQDLGPAVIEESQQDRCETVAPRGRQPHALGEGGDREGARADAGRERLPVRLVPCPPNPAAPRAPPCRVILGSGGMDSGVDRSPCASVSRPVP